ncbi:MAG: DUF3168 domain-containing protein [Terrimicrobiaceae bacterium]
MMLHEALVCLLLSDATVATLVGNRVYPNVAPQTAPAPWIVYQRIDDNPIHSHGGRSYLSKTRMQLTMQGNSYEQLYRLVNAVKGRLDAYRGTINGLTVGSCFVENTLDDYDPTALKPLVHMDVMVQHDEQ